MHRHQAALEAVGWDAVWTRQFEEWKEKGLAPGRVTVEEKHYYRVLTEEGELTGQIDGKLMHESMSPTALPKVGDWVGITVQPAEGKAVIQAVLPRRTKLSRRLRGRELEEQVLAANVDTAFVVHGLDQPFRAPALQRYLVMMCEGNIQPVVILNKADLCADAEAVRAEAERTFGQVPVFVACALTGAGMERLWEWVRPGQTLVFCGTSGVGKSTLINHLYGEMVQATAEVRESDAKGRHTTTWRELIILPRGGCVIDTPGMREFQIWLAGEGIHQAFPEIESLAAQCRFRDCSHTVETACAVAAAVKRGDLSADRYRNFIRLKRETQFLERAHQQVRGAKPSRRPRIKNRFRQGVRDEDDAIDP
jgi:ribosome biogenesis GTPase